MSLLQQPRPAPSRRAAPVWWVAAGAVALGCLMVTALVLGLRGVHALGGATRVTGSGVPAEQARVLPSFGSVELAGSLDASVRVGAAQAVVVHADDNLLGHVRTTVRGGVLVVETPGSFSTRSPMRLSVVVPALRAVSLTGSGDLVVRGVDASSFTASLPGSGTMLVTGRTTDLRADLQGSGQLSLRGLVARDAEVRLSGSGVVEVYATGSLDAQVSGSGSVMYAGRPSSVTTAVSGSGVVEPE